MSFNKKKDTLLGQIPDDWEIFSVQELVDMDILEKPMDGNHGSLHPVNKDFVNNGIPFIMASDIKNGKIDYSSCKFLSEETSKKLKKGFAVEGDVLLTHKATIGRTAIVKNILTQYIMLTPQVTYYRVKNLRELDNKFLKYYFDWDNFQNLLHSWSNSGSTRAYIGITAQRKLPILLPKIKDQKFIVNILSTLDEKIETNNQINEKLEEMAQALFKHWFVDFEFPNENGEPYKSSGGEMVESELGMIPKGWEVSSLDKIADYLNGLPMQKYRPKEDELSLLVLKIKELRNGEPDINSDRCSANIEDKYIINDGDIIFSWSGTLMIDIWCGGKCGLNQHLFKVTSQKYNKWFYYFWIKRHLDRFINIANSKATTMGHIKRKDLTDSKVLIPTSNVYEKANEILGTIINDIINLKIESKKLKAVRDILLPKLMSGEIRVPLDIETLAEQS
ncbi:restriction endonuclease subunit S [Aneurinibacillus thermoaerophilus]|uniref:restriction endonuclease subunit S n=1 Tax=Aneurinibacillus thermoaerophilus TaxID=143495 RepID=UPI002E1B1444|nr:restriction endonuclease subunit S [Aneurinibacillus thermoaerophilus]MED0681263.1 restriction endonuclease subunit S [Aneurinibacillus thermoaerophilus]MED0765438.1 restriction endonuclease subunit S [Aneurinibacillus thermoaerophilus]